MKIEQASLNYLLSRAITLSTKGRSDGMRSTTASKSKTLPSLFWCEILIRNTLPYQSYDALFTYGSLTYAVCRSTWQDIGVGSELTLIQLVTRPLPSSQRAGLIRCAAPLLISTGSFHHFFNVGFLSVTQCIRFTEFSELNVYRKC
mgnify:CR=1 FL=1